MPQNPEDEPADAPGQTSQCGQCLGPGGPDVVQGDFGVARAWRAVGAKGKAGDGGTCKGTGYRQAFHKATAC